MTIEQRLKEDQEEKGCEEIIMVRVKMDGDRFDPSCEKVCRDHHGHMQDDGRRVVGASRRAHGLDWARLGPCNQWGFLFNMVHGLSCFANLLNWACTHFG